MIGKSLANDFQYTKLKYKQYLYFSLNIPLMFLLCFFLFSLFLSPCFFFVYLNFYLMYYQDNNTEHHKVIYPPYSRNCQVLQKKRKQTKIFLFLATKRLCSVLITGYSDFQQKSNFQQGDKFLVEVLHEILQINYFYQKSYQMK